nr:hypothetical protein CFP56_11935 [Quercus suber]
MSLDTQSTNSSLALQPGEKPIKMGLPMFSRVPRIFPRNKFNASRADIALLKHDTSNLISTTNVVRVQRDTEMSPWPAFRANPVLALLHVVQIDSKTFFQSLEWALDEINQDSLDGYLMSKRLEDWRKLMSEFEIEVPAIARSLDEFVSFVFSDSQGSRLPKEIRLISEEMQSDIDRIQRKLVEAYGALRADMQFAESRRSINEAKTVTKLTELAFLFVPLSFTCSLFSMQINELAGGVPVWYVACLELLPFEYSRCLLMLYEYRTFVVTALGIAILAYVFRLVLTSEFIADSSRNALEKFWARTGVRRGDSAPVLTLILLIAQEVWRKTGAGYFMKACMVISLTAFVVVPVVFMWTSTRMDVGFDTAMTLFLVLSSLGLGIGLFVNPGGHGERVTAWQGDEASTTSGEDFEVYMTRA